MTDELIERIEAADGLDRGLDADIARAIGMTNDAAKVWGITAPHWYIDGKRIGDLPFFTSSIDAALTLMPKDGEWMVNFAGNSCAEASPWPDGPVSRGHAATPALAICASALKARKSND